MSSKWRLKIYPTYYILTFYFLIFILIGMIIDSPMEILQGLKNIIFESNILITDYIQLGGIGAAFVNSGLLSISCLSLFVLVGIKPNGSTIAALWLIFGFGLFGKNILNIWPILFGVWLYSKYQKEPFLNYILIASFSTTLAPTINELSFTGIFPTWFGIILSIVISVSIGFIIPPLTSYSIKLHQGYNLYNTGFAAGLLSTLLMSVFRSFGINFKTRLVWSTGHNWLFAPILLCIFASFILLGFKLDKKAFKNLPSLFKYSGRLVTDFFLLFGEGTAFVNMGILGIFATTLILCLGGPLNGPTMGGIFTIVGFGAFGKHIKNVTPIIIGALLSSFMNIWEFNSPSMLLAILFSTTLSPIAGHFGWIAGIIAGFLHVCMVTNMSYLHGGLNLYNNGFAGGTIAIILIPIISSFKEKLSKD